MPRQSREHKAEESETSSLCDNSLNTLHHDGPAKLTHVCVKLQKLVKWEVKPHKDPCKQIKVLSPTRWRRNCLRTMKKEAREEKTKRAQTDFYVNVD